MSGLLTWVVILLAALALAGIVRYLLFWQARVVPFYPEERILCLGGGGPHRGCPFKGS